MTKPLAPELHCPMCEKNGLWESHCHNETCTWLRCACGCSLYSMDEMKMLTKEHRRGAP